jgi:two-component SAPR family response regulator
MKNQSVFFCGLVLLVLFSNTISSQNIYHNGLLFKADPNPKEKRTSLDLTQTSPVIVRNKFSLEFDFSIWNRDHFGYIFRIFDKKQHSIDLVYVPQSSTLAILKLVVNGKPTSINILLEEKDLVRNNWLHLILFFDLIKGRIDCKLGDLVLSDNQVELADLRKLNFCFGVNLSNYFPTTDVPRMAIRNIRIIDQNGKTTHNWLLNESDGEVATDLVGNLTASVTNPSWIVNKHFNWTLKEELRLNASSGVTIDSTQNRLIFIGKDKIVSYRIVTSEFDVQKVNNNKPSTIKSESYYYSLPEKKIYCFSTIPNRVNIYDESSNEWEKSDFTPEPAQYIKSTYFLNEESKAVFSIGGYRKYRYFDILMRYSFTDKNWKMVLLKGDNLVPRYYTSVTETQVPGEYIIFGGYGNETGQQELGPKCLYDLYQLNLKDTVLKRKWNIENVDENFIPMGSTIIDEQNPALYVLGFPPFLNDTYLKLYRISLEKPGYSVVSDTIHFYFDDEQSKASLFFFGKTKEFYAVTKTPVGQDSANYKIYSLIYPPVIRSSVSFSFKTVLSNPETFPKEIYWFVAFLAVVSVYVLIILLKKLHRAEEELEMDEKLNALVNEKTITGSGQPDKKRVELPCKNAIYLFGGLQIYNSEGIEINHSFSSKLKHLFLSIFLLGNEENGISNEKLNSIHWMYHSPQSAKNNRNVNIKKLRDMLGSLKGVQLVHVEGSWSIKLSPEIFCDYNFLFKRMRRNFQPITREEFEKIILILERGMFVGDERTPWLDSFKSHFITSLLEYLFKLADSFEKDKNPEAICHIADLILKFDLLNEEAFRLKVDALVKQKNHNQAFIEYEYFTKEYEKMYGIPFPVGFKSFVRKEE